MLASLTPDSGRAARRRAPALAALLATAALAASAPAAPALADAPGAAEGPRGLTAEAVDAYMADYLDSAALPGASVAVTRGEDVVVSAGYGTDSTGAPMTARTPMGLASVSKAFTALAVMRLVEEGRVELDRPVTDYLPEFRTADPRGADITVEQLLTHTSGMSDRGFREKSEPAPGSLRGAVERLRAAEITADPGTEFSYHNPNFHVAARLVEVVADRPFADYLDAHVFTPLGMDDTVTVDTAAEVFEAGTPTGHIAAFGVPFAVSEPTSFYNGAGGMVSTADDMAAWLIAQHNGGLGPEGERVLSAEGIEATHTVPADAPDNAYALGWEVRETAAGNPLVEHGGIQFTYTAYQALLPESGYGIAVMANTGLGRGDAQAITAGLVALAEGEEPPGPASTALLAVDLVMAALTAGVVVLGVRGVRRAQGWVAGRRGRPAWATVLRLLPYAAVIGAAATVNRLIAPVAAGRDLAWTHLFYLAPTAWIWLMTGALACAAVLAARGAHAARARRSRPSA
ncbi:beta-lactamase family protein [Streptomonospora sp. S1-112]|uniref:Beta-lactamase family protein n=1 Tax=Streptomonospora mangrovi TaxID=2883123 RepID=A0A9X3SC29_9ACTN|nr:serine hydrolase domain-containing protein [Streptomonospora mangrovi]MDA0563173.1 beta-lactamase family protein [Streptomonospora mangrovi]